MQRQITDSNGSCRHSYGNFLDDYDRRILDRAEGYRENGSSVSCYAKLLPIALPSSSPPSLASSPPLPPSFSAGAGYIEHRVTKFDTLAGIAIKYGVEVADVKKMNGLATDLQMFALKSLHIPLPGRHPPSPCLSNGSSTPGQQSPDQISSCNEQTARRKSYDLFDSFQSLRLMSTEWKVSPAMSSLQGHYGLKPMQRTESEGFQMAVYNKMGTTNCTEDSPFMKPYTTSNPPLSRHRKSRSLVNTLLDENEESDDSKLGRDLGAGNSDRWNDKLLRRRQKSEADFTHTPEKLLKDDGSSGSGFSSITGKGLALRSKAASRNNLTAEPEVGGANLPSKGSFTDCLGMDTFSEVRKSSSASSLQDDDGNSFSSIWPTSKWNLKSDLQGLTTAAITSSILDGLPKPLTGRKNKAALD